MFVHIVQVIVDSKQSQDYVRHLRATVLANIEAADGFSGVWVSKREFVQYVEVLIISMWQSSEALRRVPELQLLEKHKQYDEIALPAHTYELLWRGDK